MSTMLKPLSQSNGQLLLAHALGLQSTDQHLCSLDAILVSIDIEADTSNQDTITEIGISTLDTRHIAGTSTADLLRWLATLDATHLRLEGSSRNISRIVDRNGQPLWAARKFAFGRSKWINFNGARHELKKMFCVPTSPASSRPTNFRKVIVVTHAGSNEDVYLQKLARGLTFDSFGTVVAMIDTQILNSRGHKQTSLLNLLHDIDVYPDNMHNGGNDAAYTMIACVGNEIRRNMATTAQPFHSATEPSQTISSIVEQLKVEGRNIQDAYPLDLHRCDNCGMRNHSTEHCRSVPICVICGMEGHIKRLCKRTICLRCGQQGHLRETCSTSHNVELTTGEAWSRGPAVTTKALPHSDPPAIVPSASVSTGSASTWGSSPSVHSTSNLTSTTAFANPYATEPSAAPATYVVNIPGVSVVPMAWKDDWDTK